MTTNSGAVRKNVLIPIPDKDFDPSEVAIPYQAIKHHGIVFATPEGRVAEADHRMLDGNGLGIFAGILKARKTAVKAYLDMKDSYVFQHPIAYGDIDASEFDAVILPGGHAPGMKVYLESKHVQDAVKELDSKNKIVAAICHGVLVCARSGILKEKKVTALPRKSELLVWYLTRKKLGSYYRTYAETTVEDEVRQALSDPKNFFPGPPTLFHDDPKNLWPGFVIRDRNLLTARWPGDAHSFAFEFLKMLREN